MCGFLRLRDLPSSELTSKTTPTPTSCLETSHRNCRIQPGDARLPPHLGGAMMDWGGMRRCRSTLLEAHHHHLPHKGHSGAQTDSTAEDLYPFLEPRSHRTPTYKLHLDVMAHTHLWRQEDVSRLVDLCLCEGTVPHPHSHTIVGTAVISGEQCPPSPS